MVSTAGRLPVSRTRMGATVRRPRRAGHWGRGRAVSLVLAWLLVLALAPAGVTPAAAEAAETGTITGFLDFEDANRSGFREPGERHATFAGGPTSARLVGPGPADTWQRATPDADGAY